MNDFEWKVLEMLDGRRDLPWGSAVSAALEYLSGIGYASATMPYTITDQGRAALTARRGEDNE